MMISELQKRKLFQVLDLLAEIGRVRLAEKSAQVDDASDWGDLPIEEIEIRTGRVSTSDAMYEGAMLKEIAPKTTITNKP